MKKIILVLALCFILMPLKSQADVSSAFNPMCWSQKDCDAVHKTYNSAYKPGEGWLNSDAPCTGDWGKCLAPGKTVTEISFGGQNSFTDIGQFFKSNYNLALSLAGLLAVIMIIVAGVQWTVSGGNSEMITSAKTRIGGALVGLVIAYLSYVILNTINPALVDLHLPQTWMIRPQLLTKDTCKDMPAGTKFAPAADPGIVPDKANYAKVKSFDFTYDMTDIASLRKNFKCGASLFMENGNGQTCTGDVCTASDADHVAVCTDANTSSDPKNPHQCIDGNLIGVVYNSSPFKGDLASMAKQLFIGGGAAWSDPPLRDNVFNDFEMVPICGKGVAVSTLGVAKSILELLDVSGSGSEKTIKVEDIGGGKQRITLNMSISKIMQEYNFCETYSNFKGFALNLGFNGALKLCFARKDFAHTAEQHMIGKNGVDLGDTFYFFDKHSSEIPVDYLFSVQDLKNGVVLNIDAAKVTSFFCDTNGDSPAHLSTYGYLIGK